MNKLTYKKTIDILEIRPIRQVGKLMSSHLLNMKENK